ncbi:MAG: TetR/AcrR family transcriptional regulator [bacterium]|nr:TetR/AcrR family transcriptional regulator [bacterium]
MSSKDRRERERQSRVESILDAAEKALMEKGADTVTMQQIADQAEFTKPTLYIYFRNKDDLLHAVICRGLDVLITGFRGAAESGATAAMRLDAMRDAFFAFFEERPDYFHLMHHEDEISLIPDAEPSPHFLHSDDQTRELFSLITDTIVAGAEDGSLRADLDPLMTAIAFWAHCAGLYQLVHIKGDLIRSLFAASGSDVRFHASTLFNKSLQQAKV